MKSKKNKYHFTAFYSYSQNTFSFVVYFIGIRKRWGAEREEIIYYQMPLTTTTSNNKTNFQLFLQQKKRGKNIEEIEFIDISKWQNWF